MNTQEALKIVGGLSKPSKMPGWAYGIPAAECKTGGKLKLVPGSTCEGCYADKGCYVQVLICLQSYILPLVYHRPSLASLRAYLNRPLVLMLLLYS